MDLNLIQKICGKIPDNFIKAKPTDSSYIFANDENFNSLNLYDFFGRAATVNSFEECFYYVELGFEPNKFTIFDLLQTVAILFFVFLLIKKNYPQKILSLFKNLKKKIIKSLNKINIYFESYNLNKKIVFIIFFLLLFLKSFISYEIIKNKSYLIPSFIDEYITLASNVNFFRTLDFNAGSFIGGSYNPNITSGIISSVGKVIGWEFSNDFIISRITNFLYIVLLQLAFFIVISNVYKSEKYFLILVSSFSIFLIPWWQGSLYSIGEIPATIVFVNAIFLFNRYRKISIILFSTSIVLGKTLLFLPFFFFYLIYFLKDKNVKKSLRDIALFVMPAIPWLLLVRRKYPGNNVLQYLVDQKSFILGHQTSGLNISNSSNYLNFYQRLLDSEFVNWNIYEKNRVLLIPLIFLFLIYLNKESIDNFFGYITLPIITSFLSIYLWFVIFNDTKWIRHTQHYTIIIIISILYLINFDVVKNKIHIFIFTSCFIYFFDNQKNLIPYFLLIIMFVIFLNFKFKNIELLKGVLVIIMFIEFMIPTKNMGLQELKQFELEECTQKIESDDCRKAYLRR